ncbi:2-methylcitrate dehydratase PrpD [Jatrophihabitans endophyticus]|uniref:2-methylcitrate dehydratase PrpD n=1 Tax=Jatrophihabitans endophyticus TaxID=1206085 RepID=A0A1M5LYZ5_9ACTN|nr:MmgE/PrpD family protein [Jatrophihabitans endophyticus]SHG70216.1 2-methylcitrate dehydratase PrpD [Jatrophihabitans endophyticus]
MTAVDLPALGRVAHDVATHGWVDESVGRDVRRLFVDTVGAALGGLHYPAVHALGRDLGPGRFGETVTLGTAATWLDADSGGSFHPRGDRLPPVPTAHPAPHVLPVLLRHAGRHDDVTLLRAFAAGTELGLRLGAGSSLRPGIHPHGIHGPAGAAVAEAALRGGDAATLARAFARGAALPLAALLEVPMAGGTVRNLWTGLGAYHGASVGADAAMDGDDQTDCAVLLELFDGAVCDELDADVLMGTTQPWRLRDSYLKPYACARWIHPALDALRLALAERRGAVDSIDVRTFAFAASLSGVRPASDMAARFSLPFSLATYVTDGRLAAPEFLPDRLVRDDVAALAARTTVTEEPAFTAALPHERPTSVRVRFADGTTATAAVRNARGNPADPLPDDEVAAKLRANVGDVLPGRVTEELAEWLHADPAPGDLLARIGRHVRERLWTASA